MKEIKQSEVNLLLTGRFKEEDIKVASDFAKDLANQTQMMIKIVSAGECQECPAAQSKSFALPVGSVRPRVMIVFDQPGELDLITRTIGFGAEGRTLTAILSKIDIQMSDLYFTSVSKCRHHDVDLTCQSCVNVILRDEIKRIKPETVIAVGERASDYLRAVLGALTKPFEEIKGKGIRLAKTDEFDSIKLLSIQSTDDLLSKKGSAFKAEQLKVWQELKTIILA